MIWIEQMKDRQPCARCADLILTLRKPVSSIMTLCRSGISEISFAVLLGCPDFKELEN